MKKIDKVWNIPFQLSITSENQDIITGDSTTRY